MYIFLVLQTDNACEEKCVVYISSFDFTPQQKEFYIPESALVYMYIHILYCMQSIKIII